jgi:predicted nuclease of predicted toxin-antitoxin system
VSKPWRCWKRPANAWLPIRLLLDECVPTRLRRSLRSHSVSTVAYEGWSIIKNGKLLALAAERFGAFMTVDKNLPFQQNTADLPVAVLVLGAVSNVCRFSCCWSRRWNQI